MRWLSIIILIFLTQKILHSKDLIRTDFFQSKLNWNQLTILLPVKETIPRVITDSSDPEYGTQNTAYNVSEARNKALGVAKEKISLQSARTLEYIRLNNEFQISEKVASDEAFRIKFNKFFLEDKSEMKIKYLKDKIYVESLIRFKGQSGLLNFLNIEYDTEKFPIFEKASEKFDYTGLILDARHLDAETALFPKILTDKGVEIYSAKLVSKKFAIDRGIVSYETDPTLAKNNPRVGSNPLLVVALTTLGKSKTDFSIPTIEGMKLLSSDDTKNSLRKCSVVILLSK
ncbi:MAG: hypothetical protein SFU98_16220 [Leptospiraceae bacterium]|nr:hypothetical protein [Leptospiraceae bacterium]